MSGSILLVEDEYALRMTLGDRLRKEGYLVDYAVDGEEGLSKATQQPFDLIVLDVMLPRLDGFTVCRNLRAAGLITPVLMLTARGRTSEKVAGLKIGADDYVTKPFSLRELAARVRAVMRRGRGMDDTAASTIFQGKHLFADFDAISVLVDDAPVRLTRREFELLRYLVSNRNRVVSRERLLERVWGYDRSIETRSVDVHVGRLRAKLGRAGQQIETVVGLGYRFVE